MSPRSFLIQLSILTFLVLILSFVSSFMHLDEELITMTWVSIICFTIFCLFIFYMGLKTVGSTNKYSFNNVVLLSVGVKMMFAVLFLLIYREVVKPQSQYVVVPFLAIYIIYTIFETYFMTKLSNSKSQEK